MGAAAKEVARVRREALTPCMTCPLCQGLLRNATAIAECLHTFCRECIMKEINDEDVDHCPVCSIDLGGDPEEKLRPDHNLQDIINKIFPIEKEKVASSKGATAIQPAKRKQRSLSSLVVDTPRVEIKASMTGRRTKTTRRRTASYATSPDRNGIMTSNNSGSQDRATEKQTASRSTKVITPVNRKQRTSDVDAPRKPSSEDRKNGKMADKVEKNVMKTDEKNDKITEKEELQRPLKSYVDALSRTKSPRSSPKTRAAKEQVIKNKEAEVELPVVRKGDTENEAASSGTKKRMYSKSRLKNGNKGSSSKFASLKGKARDKDNLKQGSPSAASTNVLHGAVAGPVWFSLVSLPNQKEGPQLPQLPNNYLRIKNGSMPISSVQKYIMMQLGLENADEVEITCYSDPISPSSRLQDLVGLYARRQPEQRTKVSVPAPATEFIMVLGYRRRQQAPAP